ncbi:MAG TPA: sterol desaturase family protein [Phaeodactylibacter sp.]|nr:sterol desaturase family protein [Phaeodactylibacter sp.]
MENFISFFEHLSSLQKFLWIVSCMAVFWILENIFPLAKFSYKKWKHARVNLFLLTTTIIINVVFGLITAGVFVWVGEHHFGLLHQVELPVWLNFLLGLMLLDFVAQYVVHYLLHRIKFMWRFHMVHHSDTEVDVTTGTRHHPGDYAFRELFALIAILIGGIPFWVYMFYRITTVICTYWTHANLKMPNGVDKLLSYILITPNMHKFHHHFERPWTDSNFGNIFSFWDRIFGTFVYDDPLKIKYGLDVLDERQSANLGYQLKLPFNNSIKTDY